MRMAVTRMRFTGTGTGTFYIDLNKALSLQLRKLHRQKVITTVYGGYFVDAAQDAGTSRVDLAVAPNTWPVRRSINRAFAQWRKMIAKTLANTEGMQSGKWNDFKIYLNNTMGSSPLLPKDADGHDLFVTSSDIDWDYSTLTTEDPTTASDESSTNYGGPGTALEGMAPDQFELMIVGPHVGSSGAWSRVGTLQSWVDSRPLVDTSEPNNAPLSLGADPLANLFDAGDTDDDKIVILETEGDRPPYEDTAMFGNAAANGAQNNLMRVSTSISTATQHVAPVHGFEALCGLVEVDVVRADGDWELVLDVESKGVKF